MYVRVAFARDFDVPWLIPTFSFQDEEYVRLLAAAEAQKKEAEKEGNLPCGSSLKLEQDDISKWGCVRCSCTRLHSQERRLTIVMCIIFIIFQYLYYPFVTCFQLFPR